MDQLWARTTFNVLSIDLRMKQGQQPDLGQIMDVSCKRPRKALRPGTLKGIGNESPPALLSRLQSDSLPCQ